MLLIHVHFRQEARGKSTGLQYSRTKDGAEVDFALSEGEQLPHLIECKLADATLHRPLANFAARFPEAQPVQLVRDLRQDEPRASVSITDAAAWLAAFGA